MVGATRPVHLPEWYAHFVRVLEMLVHATAAQDSPHFLSLMGRHARELNLSTDEKQVALRRGTRYKASWGESKGKVAADDKAATDRDTALSS